MQVTILGSGSGKSELGKRHAALLVRHYRGTFLLDCGEGTSQALLKHQLSADEITAVVISHLHPDHVTGLYMLVQNLYLQGRKVPLKIYLPERVEAVKKSFELFYLFASRLPYELQFTEVTQVSADFSFITMIPTNHLKGYRGFVVAEGLKNQCRSWAVCIHEAKQLLYSADITSIAAIKKYLPETDLLIIDAFHTSAEDILLLKHLGRGRIVLNHGLSETLKVKLKNKMETQYEIANDDTTYNL